MNFGRGTAIGMMLFPFTLLFILGAVFNVTTNVAYPTVITPTTCGNIYNGACTDTSHIYSCTTQLCSVNSTTSFLNPKSPFTTLLSGNVMQFFSDLVNPLASGGQQYFATYPQNDQQNMIYLNCYSLMSSISPSFNVEPLSCTQTNVSDQNLTSGFTTFHTTGGLPFVFNGTAIGSLKGAYSADATQFYEITQGLFGNPLYYYWFAVDNGSLYSTSLSYHNIKYPVNTYVLNATFASNQGLSSYTAGEHFHYFGQLVVTKGGLLQCSATFQSPECANQVSYLETLANEHSTFSSFVYGIESVGSLAAGLALLILGLGFSFGAATVNAGSNAQGTKLAQAFGVGILLWGPWNSEFGGWMTGLPLGLNVLFPILLTGLFFFGCYWLAHSYF